MKIKLTSPDGKNYKYIAIQDGYDGERHNQYALAHTRAQAELKAEHEFGGRAEIYTLKQAAEEYPQYFTL